MKIAGIQSDLAWNEPEKNIERFSVLIQKAAEQGAKLIVLPETFTTAFSFINGKPAGKAFRLGLDFLLERSAKLGVYCAGSMSNPKDGEDKPYNTMVVTGPQGILGTYDKIHLFTYGKEDEKHSPGRSTLTLELEDLRYSFLICYDLRFPQIFSKLALETDVFVVNANWPASRILHWRQLLIARAIENQTYIIGVNRIGEGGKLRYNGASMIVSPTGEILAEAGEGEEILFSELDVNAVSEWRKQFPVLNDRKPKLY